MPKLKERTLKALYDLTGNRFESEEEFSAEERNSNSCVTENVRIRVQPGTCNVCAAPCSSCMHVNQAVSVMESKNENDFSDETSKAKETNQCTLSEADMLPSFKSRSCDDRQQTASEASNLHSACSSHDSFSENAESKAAVRSCDTSETFEDVEMLQKLPQSPCTLIMTKDSCPAQAQSTNCSDANQQIDESNTSSKSSDMQETPLQSQASEGSDIVEDDIKVCDICGDTGREEMLAICSRCSDGAEHTYCMRVMLDKVPEGDWLCEECQLKEEAQKQKLDRTKMITATPREISLKENSIGGTKLLQKSDTKAEETEGSQSSKVVAGSLLSAKRHGDNLENFSKLKKHASETSAVSQVIGSSRKKPTLSRESSFKSLDMGKVKQTDPVPSPGSRSTNILKELHRSLSTTGCESSRMQEKTQSSRGLVSRSATFNNLSSRPKVKQLLEDAFQKHKLVKESSTGLLRKEGMITKSMPLRTPSSGRFNASESKSKLQSSNLFQSEDPRSLKQGKEQNLIGRKNSFKLRRPGSLSQLIGSSMSLPKADSKNVLHGGGTSSVASVNNSHDSKSAQRDGKLNTPSNPTVSFSYKGFENATSPDGCGDVKKLPSYSSIGLGISFSKRKFSSLEQKASQVGPKEETKPSSPCVGDELSSNPDVVLQDVLPRSLESAKQDGRTKDPSFSQSKQNISCTGKIVQCRRCNEVGHIAQFCTASSIHVSALKTSGARNPGDASNRVNKWKDAVEAISRTKIRKDIKLPDQSDELSISSTDLSCDVASKDQLSSSSSCVRNLSSLEGTFDGKGSLKSLTADSSRSTSGIHFNQHSVHSPEFFSAPRDMNSNNIPSISDDVLKPHIMKLSSQASVSLNILRTSAIPEHDYIWQGDFEVQRSGILTNNCAGIQAHLSTCASRRVIDVVNKFPCKVRLEEVPRLSSWPVQFRGKATEDNIALYFFAKDLESYERCYKKLVDNMLENDLALKGSIDRIELLIFPSNQLPEKSQRWNRLFFLWAVLRERRVNCAESLSGSEKKLHGARLDLDPSVQAPAVTEENIPQERSSCGQMHKEVSLGDSSTKALELVKSSMDFPFLSSSKSEDEHPKMEIPSLDQKPVNFYELHYQPVVDDTHLSKKQSSCSIPEIHPSASASQFTSLQEGCSSSNISKSSTQISSGVKGDGTSLKEDYRDPESRKDGQLQPCFPSTTIQNDLDKDKVVVLHSDASDCRQARFTSRPPDGQDTLSISPKILPVSSSLSPKVFPVSSSLSPKVLPVSSSLSPKILPVSSSSLVQEAGAEMLTDDLVLVKVERGPSEKEPSSWELKPSKKRSRSNSPETILEASCEISRQVIETMAWKEKTSIEVDGERSYKKMKHSIDSCVESSLQAETLGDRFSSAILGLDPNSQNKERKCVYSYDNTVLTENSRNAERYLFPVDSGHVRDLKSGKSIPWQILSSDDEDLPESEVPNLELALGEKRPSQQGVLPLFGQLMEEKNSQKKLLDPKMNDGDDDLAASLSLSLSFPFSENQQTAKSVPEKGLLPKKNHVNTSLLLFGGLTDT